MTKFDDYINSLDGVEDITPLEVASKLLELHNEEIGTHVAKISELNETVAEKDTLITNKDNEITGWKAKNFDLAMQIPSTDTPRPENEDTDNSGITIDDLFAKGN